MKHGTFTRGLTIAQQQEIKPIADANDVYTSSFPNPVNTEYTQFDIDEGVGEIGLFCHDCNLPESQLIEVTPEEFVRQFKEHFAQPGYMDFNGFAVHEDGSITKNGIWLYENGDGDTLNSENAIWVSGDSKWQPVLEQNPNGNWAFYIKKKD